MKTLLIGSTGYVTAEWIRNAFPGDSVTVIGNPALSSNKKHRITSYGFPMEEAYAENTVKGQCFDKLVYFSSFLNRGSDQPGELERIQRIFCSYWISPGTRMIYLTAHDSCCPEATGRRELAQMAASLFARRAREQGLAAKILRIPCLYSADYEADYVCGLLRDLSQKKKVKLDGTPQTPLQFLSQRDLGTLLYRVFEHWDGKGEVLEAPDTLGLTLEDLEKAVRQLSIRGAVRYTGVPEPRTEAAGTDLAARYGWAQSHALTQELGTLYQDYVRRTTRKVSLGDRLRAWPQRHRRLLAAAELTAGFFCTELITAAAAGSVQFRTVDFRLAFIVIMSSLYGINVGLLAAGLAGGALAWELVAKGLNGAALFYEPTNWLPFLAYFAAGVLCGYVQLKHQDDIKLIREENELLREKFLTLKGLYLDAVEQQKAYKKQIISARDSFGKIFEITKKLDLPDPAEIARQAVPVLEEMLDNRTVAVYTLDSQSDCARLAACSGSVAGTLDPELSFRTVCPALVQTGRGEVWVNTELREGLPMYLAEAHGLQGRGLLIALWTSAYEQNGIYYTNQIKILSGLIESALLRAMRYEQLEENEEKRGRFDL